MPGTVRRQPVRHAPVLRRSRFSLPAPRFPARCSARRSEGCRCWYRVGTSEPQDDSPRHHATVIMRDFPRQPRLKVLAPSVLERPRNSSRFTLLPRIAWGFDGSPRFAWGRDFSRASLGSRVFPARRCREQGTVMFWTTGARERDSHVLDTGKGQSRFGQRVPSR